MTEHKSYFVDAQIERNGTTYRVGKAEADALVTPGNYWHGQGDPSSWLCEATFRWVKRKYASLTQSDALELAARSMQITAEKLRGGIEWHENYMRWHDGDYSYHVLEPDEE